jgi:hypothetical protein
MGGVLMGYADPATGTLPFQSGSDTSRAGAESVRHVAGTQREIMAMHYRMRPFSGYTDCEMHDTTGFEINAICGRRSDLGCVPCGKRRGAHGVMVVAWTLPAEGA